MEKTVHTTRKGFQEELVRRYEAGERCTLRGNDLIVKGETVATYSPNHGGRRLGAGRKPGDHRAVTLHLGPEALRRLQEVPCKSAFVEGLILEHFKTVME